MRDPFRNPQRKQLVREAQIGLSAVAIMLTLFAYVAFHRIMGHGYHLPDNVRNAPVARTVSPNQIANNQVASNQFANSRNRHATPSRWQNQADQLSRIQVPEAMPSMQSPVPKSSLDKRNTSKTENASGFEKGSEFIAKRFGLEDDRLGQQGLERSAKRTTQTPSVPKTEYSSSFTGQARLTKNEFNPQKNASSSNAGIKPQAEVVQQKSQPLLMPIPSVFIDKSRQKENLTPVDQTATDQSDKTNNPKSPFAFEGKTGASSKSITVTVEADDPFEEGSKTVAAATPAKDIRVNDLRNAVEELAETLAANKRPKPDVEAGSNSIPSPIHNSFVPVAVEQKGESIKLVSVEAEVKDEFNAPAVMPTEIAKPTQKFDPNSTPSDFQQPTLIPAKPLAIVPEVEPKTFVTQSEQSEFNANNLQTPTGLESESKLKPMVEFESPSELETNPRAQKAHDLHTHIVRDGESYWSIAQSVYGDGRYFRALHKYNSTAIRSSKLTTGMKVSTPLQADLQKLFPDLCPRPDSIHSINSTSAEQGVYVTQGGETLFEIAGQRLGQASRYLEIMRLNEVSLGSAVTHATPLREGLRLVMPKEPHE